MTSKPKDGVSEGDEIVPSGHALQIAAVWLGINDVEAELSREVSATTQLLSSSTSKFAGLGSRKENKHRSKVAGVQYSLERKIFKSSKAKKEEALRKDKQVDGIGGGNDKGIECSDSDEGRGGAFKKRKRNAMPELHVKSKMLLDRHYDRRKVKTAKNVAEK